MKERRLRLASDVNSSARRKIIELNIEDERGTIVSREAYICSFELSTTALDDLKAA